MMQPCRKACERVACMMGPIELQARARWTYECVKRNLFFTFHRQKHETCAHTPSHRFSCVCAYFIQQYFLVRYRFRFRFRSRVSVCLFSIQVFRVAVFLLCHSFYLCVYLLIHFVRVCVSVCECECVCVACVCFLLLILSHLPVHNRDAHQRNQYNQKNSNNKNDNDKQKRGKKTNPKTDQIVIITTQVQCKFVHS